MKRDEIFPTIIWHDVLPIDNSVILSGCERLQKEIPISARKSNIGGWQSKDIWYKTVPEFHELEEIILLHATKIYANQMRMDRNYELWFQSIWININKNRDYNQTHTHPRALMSGAYYVKTPKDCGKLVFPRNYDEVNFIHAFPANISQDGEADLHMGTKEYEPKEKKLIMFLGNTPHFVQPNKSNEERISISFNLEFREKKPH